MKHEFRWSSELCTHLIVLLVVALTFAAYWVGLAGPFLLDDFNNLAPIKAWLEDKRTWAFVVFGNESGIGGRPLAMTSFLLDARLWGWDSWHFKLTNLLLHIACGVALWRLLRRLLARDPALGGYATWLAIFLAGLWLVLPVHASSVLYVVQRMAILSTLFILLALWTYIAARERIERADPKGTLLLILCVPALTAIAFSSKENGALVPLLAAVIEFCWFRPSSRERRKGIVKFFFGVFFVAPLLLALVYTALRPEWILGGYTLRDFTLLERMLTQPRILWDYVGSILIPYAPRLGIFHDNFTKSTSLISPWTTAIAIAAWLLVIAGAWRVRIRYPTILGGVLWYLAGHALESSVFALELYFEHRNYFPSVGILLALAGLGALIHERLGAPTPIFQKALVALAITFPCLLLGATHGRARVWSSLDTFYTQELRYNPESPRLRSFLAGEAIRAGDTMLALQHIRVAEAHQSARENMTAAIWRLIAYCPSDDAPPQALYDQAAERASGAITSYGMTAWEELATRMERGDCAHVNRKRIIEVGERWLENNPLPSTAHQTWRTRYYLARLLASADRLAAAADMGEKAWIDSGYSTGIGVFLFQVNASLVREAQCRVVLERLEHDSSGDLQLQEAIRLFSQALENGISR